MRRGGTADLIERGERWLRLFELRRWHWAHDVAVEFGLDLDDAIRFADRDHLHYTEGRPRWTPGVRRLCA